MCVFRAAGLRLHALRHAVRDGGDVDREAGVA